MTASSRTGTRAALCTVLVTTLAAGEACGDFPRVNPFDEGAKVSVVVSGPDVVTAIGDTVIFHAKSVQGESLDQLAYWRVPSFLRSTSVPNQFVAIAVPGSSRDTGTVTVFVNSNVASKPFLFAQQARSLSVAACAGGKVITFTSFLAASDPTYDAGVICARLLDRRGNPLPDGSGLAGVIRDTSVVRFVVPNQLAVNALSVGSTYVVYSGGGFADSIRVDVRQDLAGFRPYPPSSCLPIPGVILSPGQTLQITPVPSDANGNPIADPVVAQTAVVGMQWFPSSGLNVTISSSGLVTAVAPGEGYVYAMKVVWQPVMYCYVTVR